MVEPTVGAGGEDDEEDELGALRARHQPAPASLHPEQNNDNNRVVPYIISKISLQCVERIILIQIQIYFHYPCPFPTIDIN